MNATTNKTRKMTAANCKPLARIKASMNTPIYQECLRLANSEGGLDAAREYVGRFFNEGCRAERMAEFFGQD
jgi:hypothetical protein